MGLSRPLIVIGVVYFAIAFYGKLRSIETDTESLKNELIIINGHHEKDVKLTVKYINFIDECIRQQVGKDGIIFPCTISIDLREFRADKLK